MAGPVSDRIFGVAQGGREYGPEYFGENENMDEESRLFAIDHPDDALVYGAQKHQRISVDGTTVNHSVNYRSQGKDVSIDAMEAMKARLNEWKAKRKKSSEEYQLYVKEMAAHPDRPDIARLTTVDQKTVLGTPIPAGSTVLG